MKKILAVILLFMAPAAVFCDSIYDMVGDTLPAGKVQIEYREKFFEYNNFTYNSFEKDQPYYVKIHNIDALYGHRNVSGFCFEGGPARRLWNFYGF